LDTAERQDIHDVPKTQSGPLKKLCVVGPLAWSSMFAGALTAGSW
jgi:hypothetical protein